MRDGGSRRGLSGENNNGVIIIRFPFPIHALAQARAARVGKSPLSLPFADHVRSGSFVVVFLFLFSSSF